MRKRLGRHSASYRDLNKPSPVYKAGTIPLDSRLRNIANADFDKDRLKIECWPSTSSTGRRWGTFKQERALVLCFKIRAQHEKNLTINEFDLRLLFGLEDTISETNFDDVEDKSTQNSPIGLVDVPAPDFVEGKCQRSLLDAPDSWYFQGHSLGNPACGAMWTWETSVHNTPMLHAGVALVHPGQAFFACCHVKGKASRLKRRFKFESSGQSLQVLRLEPEASEECLEQMINNLNEEVKARNLGTALERTSNVAVRSQYGSSSIGGHAEVHFGDRIYPHSHREHASAEQ